MKLSELRENPKNPSKCSEKDLERLAGKLKRVPLGLTAMRIAYVTDDPEGGKMVISGNKRLRVLKRAYGEDAELPDEYFQDVTAMSEAERHEFIVTANVSDGEWDLDLLLEQYGKEELKDFGIDDIDQLICDYNQQLIQERYNNGDQKGPGLADRYVTIPSSVFITYKGKWKERKKQWRELINVNGSSRAGTFCDSGIKLRNTQIAMCSTSAAVGVSLFDPVLSEVMVRWFCPEDGSVFDPFAGDTLKGLVFSTLGHKFTGIELRQEQVDENNETIQAAKNRIGKDLDITYFCDDGQNVANHLEANSQDLLFSCPPYYDLEVYSDLPNDASNQGSYEDFLKILENAFTASAKCLKDDRFAVIVVGDVRDKNGFYYDFPGDVKRMFKKIGMPLYNEAILVDTLSNKRFTANNSMSNRKLMKTHQNVLVFYKGNPKNIKQNFPPVDFSDAEINDLLDEMGEDE